MSSGKRKRDEGAAAVAEEVICLGRRFPSEAARRAWFRARLGERLRGDPALGEAGGAPLGAPQAIVALSDPPHYTACPNPFIADAAELFNDRPPPAVEPLVADVREGKGDPVYNAHSYHTKVPHRAIMRFLLHYTEPGAVVLDPFAGTGMTGVAASFCGHPSDEVRAQIEGERAAAGLAPPRWGERRAILADLSSVAAFVAHRFCTPSDPPGFAAAARRILAEVEAELGWMYETRHDDGRLGRIHYVLWSDVFVCPGCGAELVYWEVAVDRQAGRVRRRFPCPACGALLQRAGLPRAFEEVEELDLGGPWRRAKRSPVLISYAVAGIAGRLEKRPDAEDLARIARTRRLRGDAWYPRERLPSGEETRRNDEAGLTHVHHFYTRRNLLALAALRARIWPAMDGVPALGLWFTSAHAWGTRLNRLLISNYFQRRGGVIGQTLQGTLYVSSLSVETNILERFRLRIASVPHTAPRRTAMVSTGSAERLPIADGVIDYIFTDPPFGGNIQYAELNVLWEAWLGVRTDARAEAVVSPARGQGLDGYQAKMAGAFAECFRVLKAGAWMTVEFSNTRAEVWNAIRSAIVGAGFDLVSVAALEKTHKGYRAVTTATAVRQDLVLSCRKPGGPLEVARELPALDPQAVWSFVEGELRRLAGAGERRGRTPPLLYDRWVAASLRAGVPLALSSAEFSAELARRFILRDGLCFLPGEREGPDDDERA